MQGTPTSPGYAVGTAIVYDYEFEPRLETPSRAISQDDVEHECGRIDDALAESIRELESVGSVAADSHLLDAHALMAAEIAEIVRGRVDQGLVNVEQALVAVIAELAVQLKQIDDQYLSEREQDVRDVGRRMLRHLTGHDHAPPWRNGPLPPDSVVVCRELMPSEAVELARSGVVAIVSEFGGPLGHTAILARSLGIPSVTGISRATGRIRPGERLLVDGVAGVVSIASCPVEEEEFEIRRRVHATHAREFADEEGLPCRTRDGLAVTLLANVGGPHEIDDVLEHNLDGVGLLRTEFLFLDAAETPPTRLQSETYSAMTSSLDGRPLVVRAFDLGADKIPPFLHDGERGPRPYLRGLRFLLEERTILEDQLRAILGMDPSLNVRVLFPMVVGGNDLAQARSIFDEVAAELGVADRPLVGAMIETPAALYALDEILELAEFVAIGTNDLTQYMLAIDRDAPELADPRNAVHPTVLRAIAEVVDAAAEWSRPVCVCGEIAGDAELAPLLVGLGIRELSVTPSRAAAVRHAIRRLNSQEAFELADQILEGRSSDEVVSLLEQFNSLSKPIESASSAVTSRGARRTASAQE